MSTPHKALSALVCVMVAFMLGIVARLPALTEQLRSPVQRATFELTVPADAASAWGTAIALPMR